VTALEGRAPPHGALRMGSNHDKDLGIGKALAILVIGLTVIPLLGTAVWALLT